MRAETMLRIRQVKHLARSLETTPDRLREVADSPERFCQELTLYDPAKPDKPRDVLNVTGPLRKFQTRLLRGVLVRKLSPSHYSHGGVGGRHILSNVQPHIGSSFVFTADISNFYPTISHDRVYRLFAGKLECSPDVASLCAKITTHDYHLALGLITSPILADQIMIEIDERIAGACRQAGLVYTRFVDDLTISGSFDLEKSGFSGLVERILEEHGFRMHPGKRRFGSSSDGIPITKITVGKGHPDVRREYLAELTRQIEDAANLANGGEFQGPYYTKSQIEGKVRFVCWVNPGRRKQLLRIFRQVSWDRAEQEAARRGLVAAKKVLVERMASP